MLALAVSMQAGGRTKLFSRNSGNGKAVAASTAGNRADDVYKSLSDAYTQGRISADSVVNAALYHKVWSPALAERCLKLAAANGNVRAAAELGVIYAFSPEYSRQAREGVKLLEAAAGAGYAEADEYLGFYYFNRKDYKKAMKYFAAHPQMTNGFAHAALGGMYLEGKGVAENPKLARDNYRLSAFGGYPRGMALYASLLGTRNGGAVDYPDEFFWYYIAGDLGDDYSRVMLYLPRGGENRGDSEVARDANLALQWIEAVHKGKSIKNEPVYKDGFLPGLKARELAAEQGDDWSRYYLGSMNYNGDFLNQNYAQAARYYEAIAKNASLPRTALAVVNNRLARIYREGLGVKADPAKAARYARAAAACGSLSAYKAVENVAD